MDARTLYLLLAALTLLATSRLPEILLDYAKIDRQNGRAKATAFGYRMIALPRQVQIACDTAKFAVTRIAQRSRARCRTTTRSTR